LTFPLPCAQPADHRGTENESDQKCGYDRAACPESDVAEDIQQADVTQEMYKDDGQHG
jgi:hypothetical protein